MVFQKVSFTLLLLLTIPIISLPSYRIDLQDKKVFEIASDDADYDEQNENEMIQPADLVGLESFVEDESRYKPLHSYVEQYNNRAAENKVQLSNALSYLQPKTWEHSDVEKKEEPFITGFKEDLDKRNKDQIFYLKTYRMKRNDEEYPYQTSGRNTDFFQIKRPHNLSIWGVDEHDDATENVQTLGKTTSQSDDEYEEEDVLTPRVPEIIPMNEQTMDEDIENTEPSDEEAYDYEKFKMEYDEQMGKDINTNKTLNYTNKEQSEEDPKEALKELLDVESKNCSEAAKHLGIKMIDCLIHNYQQEKDKPIVKKTLAKIWLAIKVWLLIYICLVIPCWCQKGWCCCCCRCKFCFPRKRILIAKKYYAINPPGTLAEEVEKKKGTLQFIKYEPTEFEQDAYETFESAIRNI